MTGESDMFQQNHSASYVESQQEKPGEVVSPLIQARKAGVGAEAMVRLGGNTKISSR